MYYLLIGVGFYLGVGCSNPKSYKKIEAGHIKGLMFGVLLWPIAAALVAYDRIKAPA
jgi:hypothetical protein